MVTKLSMAGSCHQMFDSCRQHIQPALAGLSSRHTYLGLRCWFDGRQSLTSESELVRHGGWQWLTHTMCGYWRTVGRTICHVIRVFQCKEEMRTVNTPLPLMRRGWSRFRIFKNSFIYMWACVCKERERRQASGCQRVEWTQWSAWNFEQSTVFAEVFRLQSCSYMIILNLSNHNYF